MQRFACVALVFLVACSSNYFPRRPGRVAMMMDSGRFVYVRDGQKFDHGLFGGGLEDAVAGNPQASEAASEYTGRLKSGFIATILGAVCLPVAAGYMGYNLANDDDDVSTELLVMAGCSVLMLGGSFYMISAEPYRWDAINIYNDSEPLAPPQQFYAPPPPPQQSMSMRE